MNGQDLMNEKNVSENKKYAMAYTEVMEILKYLPEENVKNIPENELNFYRDNMDTEYYFKIDINKDLEEQEISDTAKAILANIFREYWATDEEKKVIELKHRKYLEKLEEEKRARYNPDDIFKKRKEKMASENVNLPIEIKKETFFKKLINFIKGIFEKNS